MDAGETEISLKARFDEHRRPSSSNTSGSFGHIHIDCQGHTVYIKETKILTVELKWFEKGVKEVIHGHSAIDRDGKVRSTASLEQHDSEAHPNISPTFRTISQPRSCITRYNLPRKWFIHKICYDMI